MSKKILIVSSNYYEDITNNLIKASSFVLNQYKFEIEIKQINGAFEIPFVINWYINEYDGFVALGCIIRGETYHFEIISNEVTRKIMDLSIEIDKPIGFGILTCENLNQALERSNPDKGNKGAEAAKACVSLIFYPRH